MDNYSQGKIAAARMSGKKMEGKMKKLMKKIMLTCQKATFFSSIRNFKKLTFIDRFRLSLHFMACPFCREFDRQSKIIDKGIDKLYKPLLNGSTEHLSEIKKAEIFKTVNKHFSK